MNKTSSFATLEVTQVFC